MLFVRIKKLKCFLRIIIKKNTTIKNTTIMPYLVKFYITETEYDIVNLDEWVILEADHEDNEWGEPIYYHEETDRSMTFDYVKENSK
jgi:hypothetical protein